MHNDYNDSTIIIIDINNNTLIRNILINNNN